MGKDTEVVISILSNRESYARLLCSSGRLRVNNYLNQQWQILWCPPGYGKGVSQGYYANLTNHTLQKVNIAVESLNRLIRKDGLSEHDVISVVEGAA